MLNKRLLSILMILIMISPVTYSEGSTSSDSDSGSSSGTVNAGTISSGIKDIDVAIFKGEAGFSVPIASLPGRAGLGYDLSLSYSSYLGNSSNISNNESQASWVGMGFYLDSGYIYRDFGTENTGGTDFMVNTTDDSFFLSLPIAGTGKLIEDKTKQAVLPNGMKTHEYKTENDGYAKVEGFTSPNGIYTTKWLVTSADGTKYYFDHMRETIAYSLKNLREGAYNIRMASTGCTSEGDCFESINGPVVESADKIGYRWDLTKIADTNGNEINFQYEDETHTVTYQNARRVSVDYACYNPENVDSGTGWYQNGMTCLKGVFSSLAYRNCGSPQTNLNWLSCVTPIINTNCGPYVSGSGCTTMGGVCMGSGYLCDNASVLDNIYVNPTDLPSTNGIFGLFPCQINQRCWITTDSRPINTGKCYLYESSRGQGGTCVDYGGKPFSGTTDISQYQSQIDDLTMCAGTGKPAGFYIGSLRNPKPDGTLATATELKETDSSLDIKEDELAVATSATSESYRLIKAWVNDAAAYGTASSSNAINNPLTPVSDVVSAPTTPNYEGDYHCCAGFGDLKQGDWKTMVTDQSCTATSLGGITKVQEYFKLPPDAAVGCYRRTSGDLSQIQTCKGFDLGPGGCNHKMGAPNYMQYSCCVGTIVSNNVPYNPSTTLPQHTKPVGQCVSKTPSVSGPINSCSATVDYSSTCPETYVATSYLKQITDSAGNKIIFTHNTNTREDYLLPGPLKIEREFCGNDKKVLFSETEHQTRNQKRYLESVVVQNKNGLQQNKVVLNYDYKTLSGNDPGAYKKLVLKNITFYGNDTVNKLPPVKFDYDTANKEMMIHKVTYPTGGSISFEYQPAVYTIRTEEYLDGAYQRIGCTLNDPKCPQGIFWRVLSKTVSDGMTPTPEAYTTTYSYGTGVYHTEGQNQFVGYDSVSINLPTGFGKTTTWFINDLMSTSLINTMKTQCEAVLGRSYSFSSGSTETYFDLWHRMTDVAYKTESYSSTDNTNPVSSSKNYVCPVVTYQQSADTFSTKSYQNRLLKQENIVDGVTTTTVIKEYNDENGLPEVKYSYGNDGKLLKQFTSYAFSKPDVTGVTNVHATMKARHMLTQPFDQEILDFTGENPATEKVLAYTYTNYAFYNPNGVPSTYCNGCNYPINPYKSTKWIDDINVNGNPDPGVDKFVFATNLKYDIYGNLLESQDPKNNIKKTYYGDSGQCNNIGNTLQHALPSCEENSLGQQTKIIYDNFNRIESVTDTNGVILQYTYDGLHRLKTTKVTGDSFDSETYYYNYGLSNPSCTNLIEGTDICMNWVKSKKMIDNSKSLFSESISFSDGLGMHMRTKTVKDSSSALEVDTTYNSIAKIDKVTEPTAVTSAAMKAAMPSASGKTDSEVLLMYGEPMSSEGSMAAKDSSTTSNSLKYIYTNDPIARVYKVFPLNSYSTGYETQPCTAVDCTQTTYSNDGSGNYLIQTVSDANGKSVVSKTDKFGRVVKVIDANNNEIINEYDMAGNVLRTRDQEGKYTTNAYNVAGQLVSTTTSNSGMTRYTYDDNGNVLTATDSNLRVTRFVYDSLNRLTQIYVNEVLFKENSYDTHFGGTTNCKINGALSKGLLCETRFNKYGNSLKNTYDLKGRIIKVIDARPSRTFETNYEYDDAANVKKITAPSGEFMTYSYNKLNQLVGGNIKDVTNPFVFNYNDEGTINSISYPNTIVQSFTYTPKNLVESITIPGLFSETYSYDKVGNLHDINNNQVVFSYDNLYRLTGVADTTYYSNTDIGFTYDKVGNRKTRTVSGNTAYTKPDTYMYYTGTDKLQTTTGCSYTYDNVGNMISKTCSSATTTYAYDENNMISLITNPDRSKLQFEYDAMGRRTLKRTISANNVIKNTLYVYGLGSNPIMTVET